MAVNGEIILALEFNILLYRKNFFKRNKTKKYLKIFFFILKVCAVYSESVELSESPHIVLDTTMSLVLSGISKSFTSALALPTISGSFGRADDIQQRRNIDDEKRRYLLQIMPPSDIIPQVIRSIILYMNITNAGILFDKTFGKYIYTKTKSMNSMFRCQFYGRP